MRPNPLIATFKAMPDSPYTMVVNSSAGKGCTTQPNHPDAPKPLRRGSGRQGGVGLPGGLGTGAAPRPASRGILAECHGSVKERHGLTFGRGCA